jgi:hypothetical protein
MAGQFGVRRFNAAFRGLTNSASSRFSNRIRASVFKILPVTGLSPICPTLVAVLGAATDRHSNTCARFMVVDFLLNLRSQSGVETPHSKKGAGLLTSFRVLGGWSLSLRSQSGVETPHSKKGQVC